MDELKRKKFFDYVKKHEGNSGTDVYRDTKDLATAGIGVNLEDPVNQEVLRQLNKNPDEIISGKTQLSQDEVDILQNKALERKEQIYNTIKNRDFPNSQLTEDQERVLKGMIYQSPKLFGPNIRSRLNENDYMGVADEIVMRSNKNKEPGIYKRRLNEAAEFLGPKKMNEYLESLQPDELKFIVDNIMNIKNENTKLNILNKYPELKKYVPNSRFKKMRKMYDKN